MKKLKEVIAMQAEAVKMDMHRLALRAKKRLQAMPAMKTPEDVAVENDNFALLEKEIYKEITKEK